MPLRAHHIAPRSTDLRRPARTVADVPFDDLLFRLAAGVADAQTALDAHTAETVTSLAETDVEVVPSMTRTIGADGTVETTVAPAERRSLLELGFTPAHYRFSEATIDVDVDVSVREGTADEANDGTEHGSADRAGHGTDDGSRLVAGTQSVIDRRRFDRTASANARLSARLQPTPVPIRSESSDAVDDDSGGDRAD